MRLLTLVLAVVGLASCAKAPESAPPAAPAAGAALAGWAEGARILEGFGDHHREIATRSPEAQRYFDQGLRLIYAFNHDEAARAFAKAVELDPDCALCYWGAAEALGPNYNMPAMPDRWQALWEAVQLAQKHAAHAKPVEQALIGALGSRYKGPEPLSPEAMAPLNVAYAAAMRPVAKQYPDDDDVQVFFAEALMTANPWKLWGVDGKAAEGTDEIIAALDTVLARDPNHPGANHYYIHAVEASPHPEKGLDAAARLPGLMPAAGHTVHMPAHVLQRVGRYADAAEANRRGAQADISYMAVAKPPARSYYAGMYLTHNYQFLAYATSMQGRVAESVDAVAQMRKNLPVEMLDMGIGLDWYAAEPYFVDERFGRWDELLAEKAPDEKLIGLSGAYHYERACALAAKGRVDEAIAERAKLDAIAAAAAADAPAGLNMAKDLLAVASLASAGRIARAQGHLDEAIARLSEAATKEDGLAYDEPADWFVPTRHLLGAYLLEAGKPADAERVYREDLARHPQNGWALYGLAAALRAQKKSSAEVDAQYEAAWKGADFRLTASAN